MKGFSVESLIVRKFRGVGRLLVALRIAVGMSQRDLAKLLKVHKSQVSRDERNEYHGITLERATRILDALGLRVKTTVEVDTIRNSREMEIA